MTKLPDSISDDTRRLNPDLFSEESPRRRNKYSAVKVESDGMQFDSKAEHRRWCELKLLQDAGEISHLEHQPPSLVLQERFTDRFGNSHRAITYRADFRYIEGDRWVYEDVKGGNATQTEAFSMKWKLAAYHYKLFEFRKVTK